MDYGQVFANHFDLAQAHESLLEYFDATRSEGPTQDPSPTSLPVLSHEVAAKSAQQMETEARLFEGIRRVEMSIRTSSLRGESAKDLLPLELEKTRLWLELRRTGMTNRDPELVSLELEEAATQLKILKATVTEDEREDNDEYIELITRRKTLAKELEILEKDQTVNESPQKQQSTEVSASQHLSQSTSPSTSSTARRSAPAEVRENEQTTKRQKRTDDQIENRQNVMAAGGQCLNCKSNRQKPACTGGARCIPCQNEDLECIRPGLVDKNAFKLRVFRPPSHNFIRQDSVRSKSTAAVGSMQQFFDMRGHEVIRQGDPRLLEALDGAYGAIMDYGFEPDIANSRKTALHGFCAFNIFVKTNTVVNNWHLPFVGTSLEASLRPSIEFDEYLERITWANEPSAAEIQERISSKLEAGKMAHRAEFEMLRAVSSDYVLLLLEQFLKDVHIRDCKGYNKLDRKASLLAAIGLTLEQVIDFSDCVMRSSVVDPELISLLRQLALVLLSYVQPPSPLSFPEPAPINRCFRRTPLPLGVDMDDSFWYELYKASSAAIPAHLLQVMPEVDVKSPNQNDSKLDKKQRSKRDLPLYKFRKDNDQRVQGLGHSFLGMNLRHNKHSGTPSERTTTSPSGAGVPENYLSPYGTTSSRSDTYEASSMRSEIYASAPMQPFHTTTMTPLPYGSTPLAFTSPSYSTTEEGWVLPEDVDFYRPAAFESTTDTRPSTDDSKDRRDAPRRR